MGSNHISGTAEARVLKVCIGGCDSLPSNKRGKGHMTHFNKLWVNCRIFRIAEAKHLNFSVLIDTEEFYCIYDRLSRRYVQGHVTCVSVEKID